MNWIFRADIYKMGIDYACIIGEGVHFTDAFIRRLPADIVDKILDNSHGNVVMVKVFYQEQSIPMYENGADILPSILDPGRPYYEVLEDAWTFLGLTESERRIVGLLLLEGHHELRVGLMIQHYAW